ncbi:MAG: thioredoxin family protein [Planctomycetia bacterium]|nr:thioredoxin family protein [Planctomycetia bacterium]
MNLFVLVALVGTMQLPHANEGQKWHADYGEALKAAEAAKKPLLIVMHDPSAKAAPVSQVSRTDDPRLGELLSHYELCQIDVNSNYGQAVAKAFETNEVPFTVIIDRSAKKQMYRHAGGLDNGQWTTVLARYQTGAETVSFPRELNFSSGSSSGSFSRGRSC